VLEVEKISVRFSVAIGPGDAVAVDGPMGSAQLRVVPRFVDPADVVAQGSLLAPMPGTVIGVPVQDGAEVTVGQPILVLEAMKMQHTISAPTDGVVTDLVAVGQQVAAGDVLAVVSSETEENES
jgi:propionyl-CoA carboxylase alpha chain